MYSYHVLPCGIHYHRYRDKWTVGNAKERGERDYSCYAGKNRPPWYWYLWAVPTLAGLIAVVAIKAIWDYYRKSWQG